MKNLINYYSVGFKTSLFPTLLFVLGHFILWDQMNNQETQNELVITLVKLIPGYLLWSYFLSNRAGPDIDQNQIAPFAVLLTILGFMLTANPWYETVLACVLAVLGSILFGQYLKKRQDEKEKISNEILRVIPSDDVKAKGNLKVFTWDEVIIVPKQRLCADSLQLIATITFLVLLCVALSAYSFYVQNNILMILFSLTTVLSLVVGCLVKDLLQSCQTLFYIETLGFTFYPSHKGFSDMHGSLYVKNENFYHILCSKDHKQVSIRKLS